MILIARVSIRNALRDDEFEDVNDVKEVEERIPPLPGAHFETRPLQAPISPNPNSCRINPDLA